VDELLKLLEHATGERVEADTPILSSGLIDSLRFAALLTQLEETYGRPIDCSEVGADNFDTPSQMLAFLGGR
jgi:acyl carrier protein